MDWITNPAVWQSIGAVINPVITVLGSVFGLLGITLPWLKPSQTKQVGKALGVIARRFLGQKLGAVTVYARTAEDVIEGFREGLEGS